MPRVVVFIDGGSVGEIYSDGPVEIAVIDRDAEMYDEDQLTEVENERVYAFKQDVAIQKKRVDTLWEQI